MRAFPEGDQTLHAVLHLVSYALMFYFLAANLALPGLWLIGIGGACNALAIAANNGVMPAQPSALATAGIVQVPGEFANSAAVEDPKLWFLGDVFALPGRRADGQRLLDRRHPAAARRLRAAAPRRGSRLAPSSGARGARSWVVRARAAPGWRSSASSAPFRRLWIAQGISSIGDWVYPLAVVHPVVNDDGDPSTLAFLLIAYVGPGLLVGHRSGRR